MALKTPAQRRSWRRHFRICRAFEAGRRSIIGAKIYHPPTLREQDEQRSGW